MGWDDELDEEVREPTLVQINVGGMIYTTYLETLAQLPYFKTLLKTHKKETVYFVDREGVFFNYVLNFVRYNQLCLFGAEDRNFLELLKQDASFYGCTELVAKINKQVEHWKNEERKSTTRFKRNNQGTDWRNGNND